MSTLIQALSKITTSEVAVQAAKKIIYLVDKHLDQYVQQLKERKDE